MNKQRLLALMRTSLLYTNPQATDQARNKGKSGKKLTRSLMFQYVFVGLLFTVLYGGMLFNLDFSQLPGYFTLYVGLFGLLTVSQGISVIYNIFFESKDLAAYLPLPIRQSEIFLSKILVVTLTVIPYLLPLLVLFSLTAWQAGQLLLVAVIFGVLVFVLFVGILLAFCALIVLGLTRTKIFRKHKKLMTTGLMFLTTILAVVGILMMQLSETTAEGGNALISDRGEILPFSPIHWALSQTFRGQGLLGWVLLIGVFSLLAVLLKVFFLPRLYEQLIEISATETFQKRKRKEHQTTKQLLRSYNLQLIKEPNIAMQVLSSSLVLPVVMLVSAGGVMTRLLADSLSLHFIGVVFVVGLFVAYMSCNQTSFVANLISLDRENYDFIQTLPLSKKTYLKQKFLIGFGIQALLTSVILLGAGLYLKISWILLLAALLGGLLGSYLLSLFYFARDYRLLLTNWTSVTQLFQRGGGNLLMGLLIFVGMFVGFAIIGGYAFATAVLPFAPLTPLVLGGILLLSGGILYFYQVRFWEQLEK
ncbi:ABC transporter [Enterococcus sp. LJL98]